MAQDVIVNGVTYPGTDVIYMRTTDGSEATYADTSDTNVRVSDMVKGAKARNEFGTLIEGGIPIRSISDVKDCGSYIEVIQGYYQNPFVYHLMASTGSEPSVSVSDDGLVEATFSQTAGYVEGGTITATQQLPTHGAQTITPGVETVTIQAQHYLSGAQVIEGDENLKAENIVSGVSIFGVEGNAQTGVELPDLSNPASAAELFSGKQLIDANGNVVDGSFTIDNELSQQDSLIEQIKSALSGKASGAVVLQDKTATPSYVNQFITADEGYDGLGTVKVLGMDEDLIIPSGTLEITENGKHDVEEYRYVNVNVASSGGGGGADLGALLSNTLTVLDNSDATSLRQRACQQATKLETVNLPNVTSVGQYAFYNCSGLATVKLPKATSIPSQCFYSCSKLVYCDVGQASSIAAQAFNACSALATLIIRRATSICVLSNTSAISNSGIAKGTGYVYVPAALVDTYKAASNWSTYANQIRAIEDYPDICGA